MFKLEFDTDNAAFDDENKGVEISRILLRVGSEILLENDNEGSVLDINGNSIGKWSLT